MATEQQTTAEEHRREEPILTLADPVPDHAEEPQEGDAREGNEVEGPRRIATRRRESASHSPRVETSLSARRG
jgi:hypothetical protein